MNTNPERWYDKRTTNFLVTNAVSIIFLSLKEQIDCADNEE